MTLVLIKIFVAIVAIVLIWGIIGIERKLYHKTILGDIKAAGFSPAYVSVPKFRYKRLRKFLENSGYHCAPYEHANPRRIIIKVTAYTPETSA